VTTGTVAMRYNASPLQTLVLNGTIGINATNFAWSKGLVNSTDEPITLSYGNNIARLYTNSNTPGSAPSYSMPSIYGTEFSRTSNTLIGNDLIIDSSNNPIVAITNQTTNEGNLIKLTTTHTISWQRRIQNLNIKSITVDASDNIYVVGNKTTGAQGVWIAKFNSGGTLQWQNLFTSNTTIIDPIIKIDSIGDIILTCSFNTRSILIRIPSDGSIPGSGSYIIGSFTLTYAVASLNNLAGNLTTASAISTVGFTNAQNYGRVGLNTQISQSISSIKTSFD
jgi:hypothetical protein